MNRKFFFSLLVFILLIKLVFAPDGSEIIHNAKPSIRLEYDEQVVLQNASLFFIAPFFEPVYTDLTNRSEDGDMTWVFTPTIALMNEEYVLSVTVTDLVGNPTESLKYFTIKVNVTDIKIIEPKIGVSKTKTFDIIIETWRRGQPERTECKWSTFPIPSFDVTGLNLF
ncbi:hypothetical protein KY339_05420, partial [Candidatus Woesearchaeota archaeon]|nr:hypothetical protein [Candidatus Woesearchaeota archaeon]